MTHPDTIARRILEFPNKSALNTLEIYPTLRCNLDCQFCDTTDRHQPPMNERSTEDWISTIHQFAAMGGKQIFVLGGGEPFVYPNLLELLSIAKAHGLWGMITTNGTLISPSQRRQLCEIGWDEIHFSLDGATAETHDLLRGRMGTFRKLIQTICGFRVYKKTHSSIKPKLVFHWVITNKNLEEIPLALALAEVHGVDRIDFDSLIAYKPEQQKLALSEQERHRLQTIAQSICSSQPQSVQHNLEQFCDKVETRGSSGPTSGTHDGLLGAPCYKPWHHLTIQADGVTSPCCVLAGTGDTVSDDLEHFWMQNSYFEDMRSRMLNHTPPARCNECSNNILRHERLVQRSLIQISGKA